MDFISLFAGIGGLDLGFERAGMTCVAQVEKDPFCQKILQKHWAHVPKFGDIRDVGKHNLPSADLICGGFPCQPHSYVGKRRGKADDRNLWTEYLRIVDEIKPRFVVGENVLGLITTMLDEILSDLESHHYTATPFVIPACAFDAPHRRDRVFIIAKHSNANSQRSLQGKSEKFTNEGRQYAQRNPSSTNLYVANTESGEPWKSPEQKGRENTQRRNWESHWLEVATRLCGVDDGFSNRVDRLRSLGNAVVPQVAEYVGRSILQAENAPNTA